MTEEELELYIKAGKIAAKALEFARDKIHVGISLKELCEKIENFILNEGGSLAFPCNISINNVAAHDTAEENEERVIPNKSIAKLDVGVHIKGYIADAATTISFDDKYNALVDATKKALKNAIDNMKAGITTNKVGKIIESVAKLHGFNPVKNLAGHLIKRNLLHAGKSIPNYDDGYEVVIKPFEVYAVEPFLTNGKGYVYDSADIRIFSLKKQVKYKDKEVERFLARIWKERFQLPFCLRWYQKEIDTNKIKKALMTLIEKGEVIGYNVLIEETNGMVAQEEHTVVIGEKETIITTLL